MTTNQKYKTIVLTSDVLQGSPRIFDRRLAVGDIVSQLDLSETIGDCLNDYSISIEQVEECLQYCRTQHCILDNPNKYCHNCSLRVQQDNEGDGEEQDNWLRAERLFIKYFGQET